jgi:hypothetical protein
LGTPGNPVVKQRGGEVAASRADFQEVTQKVKNEKKHSGKTRAKQGSPTDTPVPNKIAASTTFDFDGKNLTPYGGLFPVATMLEKLGFQKLVEDTLKVKRIPRVMTIYHLNYAHTSAFAEVADQIPAVIVSTGSRLDASPTLVCSSLSVHFAVSDWICGVARA